MSNDNLHTLNDDWGLITSSVDSIINLGRLITTVILSSITKKLIITWVGFGTVFEIKNGRERIVAPWINSGPLRGEVGHAV